MSTHKFPYPFTGGHTVCVWGELEFTFAGSNDTYDDRFGGLILGPLATGPENARVTRNQTRNSQVTKSAQISAFF